MDVHLKDTSNDFQVVPDFSDLLGAIVEDTGVETRIRGTHYEQQMPIESPMELREEEDMIGSGNMPKKYEREKSGMCLNDSLLTPPVERLFSKLDTGPSEVFCFPSPLQLEDENILAPHGENPLVNSIHSRETVERTQDPRRQTNRESLSICNSTGETKIDAELFTKQTEQLARAGDDRRANGSVWNSTTQAPADNVKLTACSESGRLQGCVRQLICQEDANGEHSGMNCSAAANTIAWEYGTSTVVSSSSYIDSASDQLSGTREDRPEQVEHALWTGEIWGTSSSELEMFKDYPRFRTSLGPFWPTHQSCPCQENPESFDRSIIMTKMEFSEVLKPDVKIPNRTTCCHMVEQSPLACVSQELEKTQGGGNLEIHEGGLFPPRASRPPLTGNEFHFPPFSGNNAEGFELTAEFEFDTRKQTEPARNEGNRIEKCRTDIFAKQTIHEHEQPSTQLPSNRKSPDKGSNEKGPKDGTVVGYSFSSESGSGLNKQEAHELISGKSIASRSVAWRQGHNNSEKQRRHSLNNNFETLRKEIPDLVQKTRAPKILILLKARAHIDDLTKEESHLQTVMAEEKEKSTLLFERILKLIRLRQPEYD